MFQKILIANRGEIACRIIKTARRMNIATVAVYSEADADALHVAMADEAVAIGPPPASESYLAIEKIIAAAKETGAQAIHPGFGFLSENAKFMKAVEAAGLVFIGPPAGAISAMGDKLESKRLAKEAGVNTVPGHIAEIADAKEAVKIAREVGYPVMLKASAGGGGKGMRIAYGDEDCREGFASARSEAKSSFGDERILIEKYIEEPRHIEIQVLGDTHGNIVHLGERECSIQRRHQKVVEEAPSPLIDPETREKMGAQAIALARAVDYASAGTVEFIADAEKNFYFLEMNTRLQVEHPVTEMTTGLDLVEEMIRIAAGERLSIAQSDVAFNGWAIESRIYAEDPYRGFLPSIGRLTHYRPPAESDRVRNDTGVFEGAEITMFYDPMIAKLVTWGEDRMAAVDEMRAALDAFYIRGVSHNIPFLNAVMAHPRFREGRLSTNFIPEEYPEGFSGGEMTEEIHQAMLAAAVFAAGIERSRAAQVSGRIRTIGALEARSWAVLLDGEHLEASLTPTKAGAHIRLGDHELDVESAWLPGRPVFEGRIDGREIHLEMDRTEMGYRLATAGVTREVSLVTPRVAELMAVMPEKRAADSSKMLLCPMPGLVVSIAVEEGDEVKTGQTVAVVEAMKMENVLRAERDGRVKAVRATAGDSLSVDDVIVEFE